MNANDEVGGKEVVAADKSISCARPAAERKMRTALYSFVKGTTRSTTATVQKGSEEAKVENYYKVCLGGTKKKEVIVLLSTKRKGRTQKGKRVKTTLPGGFA